MSDETIAHLDLAAEVVEYVQDPSHSKSVLSMDDPEFRYAYERTFDRGWYGK